jgi:DNA-binding MarR family transcriptional regulator
VDRRTARAGEASGEGFGPGGPLPVASAGGAGPGDGEDVLAFLGVLWGLEHALQGASKRMAGHLGITGTQRFVIRMLGRQPGIGAGELADLLHDHPSTITGVLQRLSDQGLIVRRTHPTDRRRAVLHLTADGRRFDELRGGTIEGAVEQALAGLSAEDVAAARRVIDAVVGALDATVR